MTANPKTQRAFAVEVVERLAVAGYQSLWAGGCVRDQLMGIQPQDYDVATNATPDQVREVFGRHRTIPIGESFGVIMLRGDGQADPIEVATFRRDATYSDGRRPDDVTFSSAEEDAHRRDFTINGIFYDPKTDETIDYVGGQADLEKRIIRAIGIPAERFAEDKLRMLRAVRFTATFDFDLDPDTLLAVQNNPADILVVSAERIAMEMRRMLVDKSRGRAIGLLHESGLLEHLLPETTAAFGSSTQPNSTSEANFSETMDIVATLATNRFETAFAALLRPTFKAATSAEEATSEVDMICRRLKLTNREHRTVLWLLRHVDIILAAEASPWPQVQRVLIHEDVELLLDLAKAVSRNSGSGQSGVAFCRDKLALPPEQWNPAPLIDGNDLLARNVPTGRIFKRLIDAVRDAQLNGEIQSTDDAWRLVEQIMAENDAE